MSNVATEAKKEEINAPTATNKKQADCHKQASKHLQDASKHHDEAAKHHDKGDTAKAALSALKAQGHHELAKDHQKEILKHNTLEA